MHPRQARRQPPVPAGPDAVCGLRGVVGAGYDAPVAVPSRVPRPAVTVTAAPSPDPGQGRR
ncbi:hypothetical protein [Streptomyces sp. NBC_00073]|uniref:hypothetical protein n=1 Tax=Streptomyces sp. NBC_00073 TaxID=2975640 RepID=UPI0032445BD3